MPIYDYRCTSCGFEKEYLQKVSDPVMTICPECRQESFVKKLTAAGFQLKGSGWYATDFRNNGSSKPAGGDAKTDGKSESDGETKTESTTATTTAAHACGTGGCAACS